MESAVTSTAVDNQVRTRMFCMALKHHSWEPEVEGILSVIVSVLSYVYRCGYSADMIQNEGSVNSGC